MIQLKKRVISLCVALGMCLTLFAGCGEKRETVRVFNAAEYIAEGVIADFEQETGIKVVYSEFDSNEDMYNKILSTSYDVLVPSDYMIEKLIAEDRIQPVNYDNIPNFKYIDPQFVNPVYDPENKYTVPYMWCTLGILYDSEKVDAPLSSMTAMWDSKYNNRMFMMNSIRDSIGITLKMLGYSVNTTNDAQLKEAQDKLIEQRPLLLGYVTDEIKDKIISGEAVMGLAYSGEAGKAIEEKESLAFCVPQEGSIYSMDAFCIPKDAQNVSAAEKFINFMQKPEIAARNAEEMMYGISNVEGKKLMPAEMTSDESLYPPEDVMAKSESMTALGEVTEKNANVWEAVMAAG